MGVKVIRYGDVRGFSSDMVEIGDNQSELVARYVLEVDAIGVSEALIQLGAVPALKDLHDSLDDGVLLLFGLAGLGLWLDRRQRLVIIFVHLTDLV